MAEFCRPCSRQMGFPSEELEPGEICENCGAKGLPAGNGWVKVQITLLVLVLLFLFQAFLSTGKAQSNLLVAHSLVEAKNIADTVVQGFQSPYRYYRTDTMPEHGLAVIRYRNATKPDDKLNIVFSYFQQQPIYLQSVRGNFPDLMPFYIRFKPQVNAQAIQQKIVDKVLVETETGKREIRLHNEDDHWEVNIDKI